ncbi:2'-5' RNA ligase family protein [Streptomyces sp. NPDC059524]|uniref:2'-5' RNA ligase family protein n=1 Tax=Streptomyces sp. NPDC059524 TaxID=3346856 RepID=UPI00368464E4
MPETGTTAVLALVREADVLLEVAASVDARVVRAGVPAHVALLYPWIPAARLGGGGLERLSGVLSPTGPVTVDLTRTERADGFVGVPVPGLGPLATALRAAYPRQVPYGGRFGPDPRAHLTVALGAEPGVAEAIERRAARRLPITAQVARLHVVELTSAGWRPVAHIPLTGRAPRPSS